MKSCKDIAKLLIPGNKLSLFEKMETKMHLLMCEFCRKYEKQLKLISFNKLKNVSKNDAFSEDQVDELEKEIIDKITKRDR